MRVADLWYPSIVCREQSKFGTRELGRTQEGAYRCFRDMSRKAGVSHSLREGYMVMSAMHMHASRLYPWWNFVKILVIKRQHIYHPYSHGGRSCVAVSISVTNHMRLAKLFLVQRLHINRGYWRKYSGSQMSSLLISATFCWTLRSLHKVLIFSHSSLAWELPSKVQVG